MLLSQKKNDKSLQYISIMLVSINGFIIFILILSNLWRDGFPEVEQKFSYVESVFSWYNKQNYFQKYRSDVYICSFMPQSCIYHFS